MKIDQMSILELVYQALDAINDLLPEGEYLAKTPDTLLFGRDGKLDSLNLVLLIVDVEQRVAEAFGQVISLASEKAMSEVNSPFHTVGSLASYIAASLDQ